MIDKYFRSQRASELEAERANYANVPVNSEETLLISVSNHSQPHMTKDSMVHHASQPHPTVASATGMVGHHHHRSHSQAHTFARGSYHTMCQANDYNNYYNLSNIGTTIIPARSRRHSPINEAVASSMHRTMIANRQNPHHGQMPQMTPLTLMQVCEEKYGNVDAPPPMPASRNYTISCCRNSRALYKLSFPQQRLVRGHFTDPVTRVSIKPNSQVTVIGPSQEDRSKFTVCYKDQHVDMPHQLTIAPNLL